MDEVHTNIHEAIKGWLLAGEGRAQEGAADGVLEVTV